MNTEAKRMETLISLAKRRGFIYQGSDIYGGLAGTWDYGPLGTALKKNIKDIFWKRFVEDRKDMYGIDAAILMNQKVWQATKHTENFSDPLVECKECKRRFREDHVGDVCPECKGELGEARQFNMMFETKVGAIDDSASVSYLRPETAQGIFVNFKNILDSFHPTLPFGIAQIGKAFRNEITPRDFIFRVREFEQMEIEYFIRPDTWEQEFEAWQKEMREWLDFVGVDNAKVSELLVPEEDAAHYSVRTIDFEYEYPFGKDEILGLAYRTDYDLKNHSEMSGEKFEYIDQSTGERFIPHVIEPSLGVDRLVLALLDSAYNEENVDGEIRVVLKFKPNIAPVKVAVLPLMRKDGLTEKASEIFDMLKSHFVTLYDETASIGKRYRRQDEIGTPLCVTIDYDSLEDEAVTVRNRDTMEQERVAISELREYIDNVLKA